MASRNQVATWADANLALLPGATIMRRVGAQLAASLTVHGIAYLTRGAHIPTETRSVSPLPGLVVGDAVYRVWRDS
jgi:hypothetical protein